ncbi:MAG: hypothetical protein KKH75_01945 [Actinobacteria bacterium]|nr:hypothetical protein [Actinomycetota bacterium]
MLRALEPDDPRPPLAYRVPWCIDRADQKHPLVTNGGATAADFVRVFIDSSRFAPETALWGQMLPGESSEVCLCDLDPEDAVVTVAWFAPDSGIEYVWRFTI